MEQPKVDIFPLMKEAIKNEPMVLLSVPPEHVETFRESLPELPNSTQLGSIKNLWVFGEKGKVKDFSQPENVIGFVYVNRSDEAQTAQINAWVLKRFKGAYTPENIMELSSYAKGYPQSGEALFSARKLALAKVFFFEGKKVYGDIQAAVIWVPHNSENMLDPYDAEKIIALSGRAIGSRKNHPDDSVESTCFLIPKQGFINKVTGQETKFKTLPLKPAV